MLVILNKSEPNFQWFTRSLSRSIRTSTASFVFIAYHWLQCLILLILCITVPIPVSSRPQRHSTILNLYFGSQIRDSWNCFSMTDDRGWSRPQRTNTGFFSTFFLEVLKKTLFWICWDRTTFCAPKISVNASSFFKWILWSKIEEH